MVAESFAPFKFKRNPLVPCEGLALKLPALQRSAFPTSWSGSHWLERLGGVGDLDSGSGEVELIAVRRPTPHRLNYVAMNTGVRKRLRSSLAKAMTVVVGALLPNALEVSQNAANHDVARQGKRRACGRVRAHIEHRIIETR